MSCYMVIKSLGTLKQYYAASEIFYTSLYKNDKLNRNTFKTTCELM